MTLPVALAAVVDLQHAHRELLRVVDSLKSDDWNRGVPYGEWTIKDMVSHCIGDMSPSGPGLIAAGVLTPQFIAETAEAFDVRHRNQDMVEERRRYTPEDLRQLLFEAHDAKIAATMRLTEAHAAVLEMVVPMGPEYEIKVLDWLWFGYHDRQHADDIRRAVEIDWTPQQPTYPTELEESMRLMVRGRDGLLRAVYSAAEEAWDAPAYSEDKWTYRDLLAHVATNDSRAQTRLRAVLGKPDEAAMQALLKTAEWNDAQVAPLRGKSLRELIDIMQSRRHDTLVMISQLKPEHLSETVILGDGRKLTITDYIAMIGEHDSIHAGQFVPASRARFGQ
ncbi:MAG: maleylpyruvate isomerase N-terminal domain-containing protein [Chloroflexota bacterium]